MKKEIYFGFLISSCILITGCSSSPDMDESAEREYNQMVIDNREELRENIISVAKQAYKVQETISRVNNAMALESKDFSPEVMRHVEYQASYIPEGMDREVAINYKAYPEELLNLLANASDYKIEYFGKKPPIGKVVNLDPEPRNIKRHIDDIEFQAENYIRKVDIYEDTKLIHVYYRQ